MSGPIHCGAAVAQEIHKKDYIVQGVIKLFHNSRFQIQIIRVENIRV